MGTGMLSCGWLWLYSGALLMLLELASPGFVIFFFGLAAATVGGIRLLLDEAFTPTWQMVAFSALSIVYLVFLRRWVKSVFLGDKEDSVPGLNDEMAGRTGRVTVAINPPAQGRVAVGDAEWDAIADIPMEAGRDVVVAFRRNLTLKVVDAQS